MVLPPSRPWVLERAASVDVAFEAASEMFVVLRRKRRAAWPAVQEVFILSKSSPELRCICADVHQLLMYNVSPGGFLFFPPIFPFSIPFP